MEEDTSGCSHLSLPSNTSILSQEPLQEVLLNDGSSFPSINRGLYYQNLHTSSPRPALFQYGIISTKPLALPFSPASISLSSYVPPTPWAKLHNSPPVTQIKKSPLPAKFNDQSNFNCSQPVRQNLSNMVFLATSWPAQVRRQALCASVLAQLCLARRGKLYSTS